MVGPSRADPVRDAARRQFFAGYKCGKGDFLVNGDMYHPGHSKAWAMGYTVGRLQIERTAAAGWKEYRRGMGWSPKPAPVPAIKNRGKGDR